MLEFHQSSSAVATVMGTKVSDALVHKFGCIVTSSDSTNEVMHFVEKPETVLSNVISCGIYLFTCDIFETMASCIQSRRAKAIEDGIYEEDNINESRASLLTFGPSSEERICLEQDVLRLLAGNKKLYCYVAHPIMDFWMQVNLNISFSFSFISCL